jgi:CHAD domain-containing protein
MIVSNNETNNVFGARTLLQRLEVLGGHIAAVRSAGDTEAIHDLRVACRRMRTALGLFKSCLPPKKYVCWEKEFRRTTKRLGRARDLDVQIEFLQQFLKVVSSKKDPPGIKRLMLRLQQNRQTLQPRVIKTLDRLEKRKVGPEMENHLGQILAQARIAQVPENTVDLFGLASSTVAQSLTELLAFEPLVLNRPQAKAELHQMRIAAKHLRYTMEVFEPLYPDALKEPIRAARKVQQFLGQIHDCDVWIDFLPEFLEAEHLRTVNFFGQARSFNRLKPGLAALRNDRELCRNRLFGEFTEFWHQAAGQNLGNNLLQILNAPLVPKETP